MGGLKELAVNGSNYFFVILIIKDYYKTLYVILIQYLLEKRLSIKNMKKTMFDLWYI